MPTAEPQRRFHLTPGHCLLALLAVEGALFLSQWFRWLPKGWPVLLAVAAVGVVILAMFRWFGVALIFRRRFQFSIRSLLVLVVVVAVPCSWLAAEMKRAREQRDAAEAIEKLGGRVGYDWEFDEDGDDEVLPRQPGPAWLRNLLGNDLFAAVVFVAFFVDSPLTDAGLTHVVELPQLQTLWLDETPVTDAGLAHLARLTHLQSLRLWGTKVTGAGLVHLARMTRLQQLSLNFTEVTDVGLAHLAGMTQLRTLWLDDTLVTDAGLVHLAGMTKLKILSLHTTKVTDAGVAKLQQALPNCKIIR